MKPCNLSNALLFDDPERVDEARAICKRECDQLIECRYQALHTDVAGVCGGMTEQERAMWRETFGVSLPGQVVILPRDKCRRPPPEVTLERRQAAHVMRAKGMTQRQIASALDVSQQCVWYLLKTAEMEAAS
jgi:hypothetical protein